MLLSEAALGYLMHNGKPVIDRQGEPVRLCEGLWDRRTHDALKKALFSRQMPSRRSNRPCLLTEIALCGNCRNRLFTYTSARLPPRYSCTARNKGWKNAQHCRPAPLIRTTLLDEAVEAWFLETFGDGMILETVYDPGNGVAERIAELRASRERLRLDRQAGLYDSPDDAEWFRKQYAVLGQELAALELEPQRPPGMVQRPTGQTVADRWRAAPDVQARKEILLDFRVRVTLFPVKAPVRWVAGVLHGPDRPALLAG
ncbi:zinc ribbon domain-containing protein [Streptomyces sp. NPDC002680]|uniref:zinc ribbon domain-containing protein n=1 Tax=Streptomyces sp. NPDC002680 TaxID=3364659 RepID=UPI003683030C